MIRRVTLGELKAAREDPRQLHMLPPVSPNEVAAMRTVAAVAFDQVDRAIASGEPAIASGEPASNYAEFRRAYRMVMETIERLEKTP